MQKCIIVIVALFASALSVSAQDSNSSEDVYSRAHEVIADMVTDGILSDESYADVAEIADLLSNPIDLNSVDVADLHNMIILTEQQINGIIEYRNVSGGFVTINDLLFVDGFDYSDVRLLEKFFRVEPKKETGRRVKNELLSRVQFVTPRQQGFIAKNDSTGPAFLGKPIKLLLRNKAEYGDWQVGLTAESDAGEPMFSHGISVTDFTSAYVQYKNLERTLSQVVLGHFFAQYGEGLGMWTGFAPNTSSLETSVSRRYTRLRSTMSVNESDYLRGVAVSIKKRFLQADVYLSHTDNDASVITSRDSLSDDFAQSIQNDGYHRTESEISSRYNISQIVGGGYVSYSEKDYMCGIGANNWHGSKSLGKKETLYLYFRPETDNLTTLHANYRVVKPLFMLYGEVAYQSTNTIATTHGADFYFDDDVTFTLAMRKFGKKYYCIKQNPNSRASQPGGETGVYFALSAYPFDNTKILANVDIYRNSWLAYQKPFPYCGYKSMVKVNQTINSYNDIVFRMKFEDSEKASSVDNTIGVSCRKMHIRLQWNTQLTPFLKLRTTLEKSRYSESDAATSDGFWLGQEMRFKMDKPNVGAALLIAHFDTDDYDSRIYASILDVPYSMSLPSYSDRGYVIVGRLQWKPYRWLSLWALCNHTCYSDKEQISSGHTMIDAPHKTEVKIQVKINLSRFVRTP